MRLFAAVLLLCAPLVVFGLVSEVRVPSGWVRGTRASPDKPIQLHVFVTQTNVDKLEGPLVAL